jgi:uncharacterized protein YgbK (DUF1537 family)
MTLQVAIIADDLTGALDTGTPFVEAGLSVAVAIDIEALAEALACSPDVLVVNTASRALSGDEAAARIDAVAAAILAETSLILFKKIDSRLKGNVAAESIALASATDRETITVAPAIPDQQRFTVNGAVTGRGVETPLPIRPIFPSSSFSVDICDTSSDDELDDLVRRTDWTTTVAVGARGLGGALARSLAKSVSAPAIFAPSAKTLFAFGSRDPITSAQIEHLANICRLLVIADAPAGELLPGAITQLPAVARCCGDQTAPPETVAAHFAEGICTTVERTQPQMIMMGGGDTALAILKRIGATVLIPKGEIEAGIPWFEIKDPHGRTIRCAVKSGGFGNINSLLKLVPENLLSQRTSDGARSEKQAW